MKVEKEKKVSDDSDRPEVVLSPAWDAFLDLLADRIADERIKEVLANAENKGAKDRL